MNKELYILKDYQKKKPFSNFLSGIAGKMGVPIWSFYINRGQAIASFGTRDKNGAIMEFFPANGAYLYSKKIGFRTIVKIDNKIYEFFNEANENQIMTIEKDKLTIEEVNEKLAIKLKVIYHTLPNEKNGGLVRKIELTNLGRERSIVLVDGLAQILPAGIDYGGYKSVSNLLQSWMEVLEYNKSLFFKLRASTDDSSEISLVEDGNYYYTARENGNVNYIFDSKVIFAEDTTLTTPFNLIEKDSLLDEKQVGVNQVPSAFTYIEEKRFKDVKLISLIGYTNDLNFLDDIASKYSYEYLNAKEIENKEIHNELVSSITTETAYPLYDEYMNQNYLDNVLRGGVPLIFKTKNGVTGYHIYSRKHGDLERDYNFFSIEPKYFSQGNGNFRDVLQNRRNDLIFNPALRDSNLYQFASLIQADGYNPLSIEGLKFKYEGNVSYGNNVDKILEKEFTPGDLSMVLEENGYSVEDKLIEIISESNSVIKATFGEGYWEDHFTYLDDVIASVEEIYPDQFENILYDEIKYGFYNSPVYVKPRNEKYVLTKDGKVRQYDAINHFDRTTDWLLDEKGNEIKVNLISKLVTLILNKYAHLDPFNIGLSYEANKPGWNDAMNGLPGLFGSGVSETVELLKLVKRTKRYIEEYKNKDVLLLDTTYKFFEKLEKIEFKDDLSFWNERMNELENYRKNLLNSKNKLIEVTTSKFENIIAKIESVLKNAITKAKSLNKIIPTYLTYSASKYEVIKGKTNTKGESFVEIKEFKLEIIPTFLEGPTRYLKVVSDHKEALNVYETIKASELYDSKFSFYKTGTDLTNQSPEIGRIHAFTKGWLERESNFLHMTYKYMLSILNAGLYDEFYKEIKTNYTCFMDPNLYGRSPFENSSFIAPSNNPDYRKQGQGFFARLSGSTAEMLSMWKQMFFGKKLFNLENGNLVFEIKPKLHKEFFVNNSVKTRLFSDIEVEIINEDNINTFDNNAKIAKIVLDDEKVFEGNKVYGEWVQMIRQKSINKIKVYIIKEEKK
ncbi:hypothetical protein [Haploplasma axanthum]|uniref:Cellobiose phosphorylase n=1 Tax=Haploplasma axanthum TaxID=29552 RepID=A0A449BE30_HAPAX|nr:hypothetical protein [Haploplasma axanthum]VEU80713.1 Uncharacterised protein [Haploplasma axanthum]